MDVGGFYKFYDVTFFWLDYKVAADGNEINYSKERYVDDKYIHPLTLVLSHAIDLFYKYNKDYVEF